MKKSLPEYVYATMKVKSLDPVIVGIECTKKGKLYVGTVVKDGPGIFTARRLEMHNDYWRVKEASVFYVGDSLRLLNEEDILHTAMEWSIRKKHDCIIDSREPGQKELIKKLYNR